jgi:predicted membrane protein
MVHLLLNIQQLTKQNAGLIVLLVLALGTFLAGIQLGWRLFVLGAFMWIILVMAAYLQGSLWVMILIGVVMISLFVYLRGRSGKSTEVVPDSRNHTVP